MADLELRALAERLQAVCLGSEGAGASGSVAGGRGASEDDAKDARATAPRGTLAAHGAVSAQVALAMAEGARARFATDLAVSVTGIAGPGGASPGKPVGLTYVGLADAAGAMVRRFTWDGDREANKTASARVALELLLERATERAADREQG